MLGAGQSYLCENARAMMRPLVTSLCLPLHRAEFAAVICWLIVVVFTHIDQRPCMPAPLHGKVF